MKLASIIEEVDEPGVANLRQVCEMRNTERSSKHRRESESAYYPEADALGLATFIWGLRFTRNLLVIIV